MASFLAAHQGADEELDRALASLTPEAFYMERHRLIFRAIADLRTAGEAPGLIVVTDRLRQTGKLDQAGGAAYLTSLMEAAWTPALLSSQVRILKRDRAKRVLFDLGAEMHHAVRNGTDPEELLALADRVLGSVRDDSSTIGGAEEKNNRRINAAALLEDASEPAGTWWPFLQPEGLLGPGVIGLLSGYAKSGKTTTIALALDGVLRVLPELRVVWCTEEHRRLWRGRLVRWRLDWPTVELVFPGTPWAALTSELSAAPPDLLIVDTARAFLEIRDENEASNWKQALAPLLLLARQKNVAVLLVHHLRKSGGDEGLGHAGNHALVGAVDVAIELRRDPQAATRRIVRTVSRFPETPPAWVLELREGAGLGVLGDPEAVTQADVFSRLMEVLDKTPRTASELQAELGEPRPSLAHLYGALKELHRQGRAQRHGKGTRGAPYRWAVLLENYSSSSTPVRVEEKK